MVEYYRQRAIAASLAAGFVALAGIVVLHDDAKYVFDGLTSRALAFVIISALCGVGTLILLVRESNFAARFLAIGAVASVVIAWGVAQWPYLLPTSLKVSQAAAPDPTLTTILIVFGIAAVVILPSLALLYTLDQKSLLDAGSEESVAQPPAE
jgi:cytochrome bd ubiquinol oxidase subunit II